MTTDKHGRGNRQQLDLSATVHWENTSGETVPAFGVVQLRSNFSSTSKASKPNAGTGLFFVNGPVTVEASAFGESFVWNKPRKVLLDGSPEVGDEVGPVEDQWYMAAGGVGWRVLHQSVGGVGIVVKDGGGGAESQHIWFEIESVVCNDDDSKTLYATPTWHTGGCDSSVPGEDEYGQVEITDICGILNYYTTDWLESGGVTGRATYMYPRDASYCEPKWIVDQICGQPECA